MTALLLTWTQRGWPYDDVRRMVRDFKSGELVEPWRIQAFRQAFDGQRAFLLRQGGNNGIFGVGTVVGEPYRDPTLPAGTGPMMVNVRFSRFVDPCQTTLLTREQIGDVLRPEQIAAQASGFTLSDDQAEALDALLATTQTTDLGGSGDWTPAEMNAAIDSYLQMLRKELAGESYSKTEYRLALAGTIARPEGAIERKHQNISAILSERGLPWIRGYLPSAHYQQSLTVLLLEALAGLSPIGAVDEVPQPKLLSFDELIVPPPQLPPRSPTRGNTRTAAPGTLAQREAMNRTLGRAGEKYILEVEQQRLRAAGRPDLAARVRWVSELDGDGAGYDISSFSNEGQPLRIEVKTTLQNINTPFYLTAHELRTAAELEGTYRLFRLFNFGKAPRMYQLSGPLESALNLSPILYRADPTCIPGPEHQPGPPDADAFGL